jgi:antitoxin CptB
MMSRVAWLSFCVETPGHGRYELWTCADLAAFSSMDEGPRKHGAGVWHCAAISEEAMSGTTRSSEGLDHRRRQLLFRSWHRGMREMDLIMGRFADATIEQLTPDEMAEFERLMEVPDQELLSWITGEARVAHDYDTALFRRLRDFSRNRERTE